MLDRANHAVQLLLPVYNGERLLTDVLDSICSQTFSDWQLLISDNASLDRTAEICALYVSRDSRITYYRQSNTIPAPENFSWLLHHASSQYVKFVAADDVLERNVLKEMYFEITQRTGIVSVAANSLFKDDLGSQRYTFNLEGSLPERLRIFIDFALFSHGFFYALHKLSFLKESWPDKWDYFAIDWIIIVRLLLNGDIVRTPAAVIKHDCNGTSSKPESQFRPYINSCWDIVFPLRTFSINFCRLVFHRLSYLEMIDLLLRLLVLNGKIMRMKFFNELFFLRSRLKPMNANRGCDS